MFREVIITHIYKLFNTATEKVIVIVFPTKKHRRHPEGHLRLNELFFFVCICGFDNHAVVGGGYDNAGAYINLHHFSHITWDYNSAQAVNSPFYYITLRHKNYSLK